ncbi:MAG: hypothetical protein ABIS50_07200 [Luteolibacter sp.]|uniref:hypothetical protein n=1 Tax=Luteolibacter sp. TaxID=1962973 RepID=UPI0032668959
MKTTLDLPDDLLIEAKAVAARRRTTLKAMVEHALRREIMPSGNVPEDLRDICEMNELGMLVLKKTGRKPLSLEDIQEFQEQLDREDMERALNPSGA